MSGLLTIIPVLDESITDKCIDSILMPNSAAGLSPDEILLVDNSREGNWVSKYGLRTYRDPNGHNLGVARSWNIGVQEVLDKGLDYLLIMSTSMLFGPELHITLKKQLKTFWGENFLEADGHSWHCIAIHRRVFNEIGLFDTNYYPAYEEQIDWCYRARMVGLEGGWRHIWFNAMSQGSAMHNNMISCPNPPLQAYYADKWGGKKGEEKNIVPWGDKPLGYFPEYSIPELAEKYNLGEYGIGWW